MPRKTSHASKKDAEAKVETDAPRRSGRAVVTKQEVTPVKEASRSRRSSTAAQTAASVADSKTPKGRTSASSYVESTPTSSSRSKTRESGDRAKAARRSTGRVNYRESDGEEEAANPKFDENFVSGEEFDESDSDEKSKPKGKAKAVRSPTKKPSPKRGGSKGGSRSRRGRPSKKKEQESEEETFDVTDDSVELEGENEETQKKVTPKRGRKQKSQDKPQPAPKSSRRSARAASKEESPRKRSTRGAQVKKYTEDEDEVEEIVDTKDVEEEAQDSRKRKRESSPEEVNKRLKEDLDSVEEIDSGDNNIKKDKENDVEENAEDEPMEVEEAGIPQDDTGDEKNESLSKIAEPITEENKSISDAQESDIAKLSEPAEEKMQIAEVPITEPASTEKESKDEASEAEEEEEECIELSDNEKNGELTEKHLEPTQPSDFKNDSDQKDSKFVDTEKNSNVSEKFEDIVLPDSVDLAQKLNDHTNTPIQEIVTPEKDSTTTQSPSVDQVTKEQDASFNGPEANSGREDNISTASDTLCSPTVNYAENQIPKANGEHSDMNSTLPSSPCFSLPGRKYTVNCNISESVRHSVKDQTFSFVSYNLGGGSDACFQKEKLLNELNTLDAHIICLQQVQKAFYSSFASSFDALGFKSIFSQPDDSLKGMVTFYKSSLFRLNGQSEVSLKRLIDKELEASSLDVGDKMAVKTHVKRCGNVLFTHFSTVIGTHALTVANVQIPPTDLSIHALQVSCLAQEVVRINGGVNKPLLLGGEFNIAENDASYQLLRDGYLSNDMIEELQRRKDVALPEKENASLVNLMWKSFQHPSSNLCSCYKSVLDHELSAPQEKLTSPDLLWFSSDSLYAIGVLDLTSEKMGDCHFSLKADVAFSV